MNRFRIYTTVDITHTNQYRFEPGKETQLYQEQNFRTMMQTLGIRSNVTFYYPPNELIIEGDKLGFNTPNIIRVWEFDFYTDKEQVYEKDGDPIGLLLEDFEMVPFIAGLNESMEQNYSVFVTDGPSKNIIFIVL